ncbi:helix-turn-helix domain-containing protein [Streptomyces sp. ARC12]|uniref:helix-turn-helix domain-containing protein n=1 Tax=Streptomyces sp. ARC12 TaxID=2724151 RepID=UPI0038573FBF
MARRWRRFDGPAHAPDGALVRAARRRDGRLQAAVAGLCGINTDYLSQIERGRKKPSGDVLAKLAAELGVAVGTLLGDGDAPAAKTKPAVTGGAAVVQALLRRKDASLRPAPVHELRDRVEQAWKVWQTSPTRFTDAETLLPDLIRDAEGTIRALRTGTDAGERREALRVAADLYGLLRSYYRRVGRLDLSLMVAEPGAPADRPVRYSAQVAGVGLSRCSSASVCPARRMSRSACPSGPCACSNAPPCHRRGPRSVGAGQLLLQEPAVGGHALLRPRARPCFRYAVSRLGAERR